MEKIYEEASKRIKNLTQTELNSVNLFKTINEHALSLHNYYIDRLILSPEKFEKIDKNIRRILMDNHIHLKPANKKRFYLPRKEFGRGLESVSNKAERIILQFYADLKYKANYCLKRAEILLVINSKKTHTATIAEFLSRKYNENVNELKISDLVKLQREYLCKKSKEALALYFVRMSKEY
ncbi:uncharacterized protein LOC115232277 [Octopus sinensis]|uniref:Uncharacterized protein LOC115232277 n=1 Tax=Octopus sinensis TaxID=2607531 RepID=A0A6P7U9D1_9MOLL|nr:uncharacterized protein LOC115232277 [Octopus sinensis]